MDASERTRQIRSLLEFQAKVNGTNKNAYSQSSEVATGALYGAIVSDENGCCDSNYAAYFTVEETERTLPSVFDIPAGAPFTIEWWQTEVEANAFQSRNIFSFGSFDPGVSPEFGCVLDQGSVIVRIAGVNYPEFPTTISYYDFDGLLSPTHFAMVRGGGTNPDNICVYRDGGFLGEFTYGGAIPITNTGATLLTLRNETSACALAQMYGDLTAFRWTSSALYSGTDYYPAQQFIPPSAPFIPDSTDNVITINNFPTSGSVTVSGGFNVTRYAATDLPPCS
jgi:hypothetical protein